MLKIGLIGAGWHATADHAPALRHCAASEEFRGRVELTAVFDIDGAKAANTAKRFGFRRAYDSVETLLADVDAVISIVPPAAMATTLASIIQHTRPVLIEKPVGRDIIEARRIVGMLDGHPHMVSLNRRFDPGVTVARQWLAQQSPPRVVHGIIMRRERHEADFAWSTGIHLADMLCFLAGPLRFTGGQRKRFELAGSLRGDTAGGGKIVGRIQLWPVTNCVQELIHIAGEGWWVRIEIGTHQPWRACCHRNGADEIDATADPETPPYIRNGTTDETAAFLRGVMTNQWTGPTLADAIHGTLIAAELQDLHDAPAYHGRRNE